MGKKLHCLRWTRRSSIQWLPIKYALVHIQPICWGMLFRRTSRWQLLYQNSRNYPLFDLKLFTIWKILNVLYLPYWLCIGTVLTKLIKQQCLPHSERRGTNMWGTLMIPFSQPVHSLQEGNTLDLLWHCLILWVSPFTQTKLCLCPHIQMCSSALSKTPQHSKARCTQMWQLDLNLWTCT